MTEPTTEEAAALATFPTARGGDSEDHMVALVEHLRGYELPASPVLMRAKRGRHYFMVLVLPSGALINTEGGHFRPPAEYRPA